MSDVICRECERLARSADAWQETAAQHCRNEMFYRGLIVQIGEPFGIEARTSDDGSIQEDVLALRVPELVERIRAELAKSERSEFQLMDERDSAQGWADQLAYSIGTVEQIGEHSNLNNPWANALDQLESLKLSHAALVTENSRLKQSLGIVYDKWENGIPCHVSSDGQIDEDSSHIGNAFRLSFAEEQEILNLIVDKAEDFEQACANCNKPYRAHLLHDGNKCAPGSVPVWFPSTIATALATAKKLTEATQ